MMETVDSTVRFVDGFRRISEKAMQAENMTLLVKSEDSSKVR